MQTIIYLRTSTEEQNPENQLKDCVAITPSSDYVLIEEKQSAFKDSNREQFNKVIALIKKRQVEHLVVWDWDRIYRSRKKLKEFFELCRAYGCKIHSVRQQWLEDISKIPAPWDEIVQGFLIDMIGWIAEDESKKKSERVKAAVRRSEAGTFSRKGNRWGRKPLSAQSRNNILRLREQGYSMKVIATELKISTGLVHKTLAHSQLGKNEQNKDSVIGQ